MGELGFATLAAAAKGSPAPIEPATPFSTRFGAFRQA